MSEKDLPALAYSRYLGQGQIVVLDKEEHEKRYPREDDADPWRSEPLVSLTKAVAAIDAARVAGAESRENTLSAMYKHDNGLCRARIAELEEVLGELLAIRNGERFNVYDAELANRCTAAWEAVQKVLSK